MSKDRFVMKDAVPVPRRKATAPVAEHKKYPMYLKGVIHITDKDKKYEILYEEFFNARLEKNGHFLDAHDMDLGFEYALEEENWGFEPEIDKCYSVLWNFNLICHKYETMEGTEYDSDIDTNTLEFDLIDEKHTKLLLEPPIDTSKPLT